MAHDITRAAQPRELLRRDIPWWLQPSRQEPDGIRSRESPSILLRTGSQAAIHAPAVDASRSAAKGAAIPPSLFDAPYSTRTESSGQALRRALEGALPCLADGQEGHAGDHPAHIADRSGPGACVTSPGSGRFRRLEITGGTCQCALRPQSGSQDPGRGAAGQCAE